MSVIGSFLMATGTTTPIPPYYSLWASREGDAATFVADIIQCNLALGTAELVITVEHKNREDTDAEKADAGSFAAIGSKPATPPTLSLSGLKELYRYRYEVKGTPGTHWVQMRMQEPSWKRN